VMRVCAEACESTGETVSAANFNSPEQTVIAGTTAAVASASEVLKAKGAKRVMPLPVSAPFHCALMAPAAEKLLPYLQETSFGDMTFPVITNVDAVPNMDFGVAREALVRQVSSPVRWVETVALVSTLADGAVEVGPGTVLSGLAKRIAKGWSVRTTSTAEGVESVLRELAPS
jgi:[acyl-carrier-protein] S-malonyltransferase